MAGPFEFPAPGVRSVYAVVLKKGDADPVAPQSDEEKVAEEKERQGKDKDKEKTADKDKSKERTRIREKRARRRKRRRR